MTDDERDDVHEALAWLAEHARRIPPHRRRHAFALLERVERLVPDEADR